MVNFKPETYIIEADTPDIVYIYSRWKEWVIKDINAMYHPAFTISNNVVVLNER